MDPRYQQVEHILRRYGENICYENSKARYDIVKTVRDQYRSMIIDTMVNEPIPIDDVKQMEEIHDLAERICEDLIKCNGSLLASYDTSNSYIGGVKLRLE